MTLSQLDAHDMALRDVSPLQVAAYLRANGWQEQSQDDRTAIWTLHPPHAETDDYFEVLLPLRPDFRDFAQRMAELFCTLEEAEQRSRNDILDSLLMTGADLINLRIVGDRVTHGSLLFADAVRLTQRAMICCKPPHARMLVRVPSSPIADRTACVNICMLYALAHRATAVMW